MSKVILIHYHEISLKGKNRWFFEDRLIKNIQAAIRPVGSFQVRKTFGRLFIDAVTENDWPQLKTRLQNVFGIANFALAEKINFTGHSEADTEQKRGGGRRIPRALGDIKQALEKIIRQVRGFSSFRISARRAQKDFTLTSQELNEKLGKFVQEKTGARVDLKNPEIIFYVEIVNKDVFIYTGSHNIDKGVGTGRDLSLQGIIQGPGGLPVGVSGKAVCLISGGIDSPVAAWLMMKRGMQVHFVHFHSAPQTDEASQQKVKEIVKILNEWQIWQCHSRVGGNDNLFLIPFLSFQKIVVAKTPSKYRVILYRREMLRQAEKLARQIGAQALITGDALGQVASQTIENLAVIEEAVSLPVLRPLIGFDKQEIINLAQKIGTYNISIEPHQDCCSLFIPQHPATKTDLETIEKIEKSLT